MVRKTFLPGTRELTSRARIRARAEWIGTTTPAK